MLKLIAFALACSFATVTCAATAPAQTEVRDLAGAFDAFWQRTQQEPSAQRVAEFKQEIAPLFPAFYGIERYQGHRTQAQQDRSIAAALDGYPKIRSEYLKKSGQFERDLPRYTASFQAAFPDYKQSMPIYFLHSLGEMDGGPREFDGRSYLVFGIDGMVRYHGTSEESAFFHHELFHTYHAPALAACSDSEAVWVNLWSEGLATYVSKVLNPAADDKAMLLDAPEGMARRTRLVLKPAFANLESVLDRTDREINGQLFMLDGKEVNGLPARRGYLLGYLVAQEAGKTRSLQEMAKLDCKGAREVVGQAVARLKNPSE